MNDEGSVQSGPKPLGARGCMMIGCGSLVLLLIIAIIGILVWRMGVSRRVDARLAAIQAAGEPTTPAELAAFSALPADAKDVTELWLKAIAVWATPEFAAAAKEVPIVGTTNAEVPPLGQPWPDIEAAEKLLEDYKDSLTALHTAAAAMDNGGAVKYTTDYSQGIRMEMPHVQRLRNAARMLDLEMRVKAHRGDMAGAADAIHTINKAGETLANEPVIVSMLVRSAIQAVSEQGLRDLLPHLSSEDLRRLADDFRATDFADHNRRAMIGERVFGIHAIGNPDAAGGPSMAFATDNLEMYLVYTSKIVDVSKQPLPDAIKDARMIGAQLNKDMQAAGIDQYRMAAVSMLVPSIDATMRAAGRSEANQRLAETAIAAELFRRKTGVLPDSLDDLVPEFLDRSPIDVMDGNPMRYVKDKRIIYSIGENLVDDGGVAEDRKDVVFRLTE